MESLSDALRVELIGGSKAEVSEADVALVQAACAIKGLDPASVISIRLTIDDIFLVTEVLGEIRVERSALPVHAEQPPEPLLIRDVPSNTLAALAEAGYTTLGHITGAFDKELLEVDGVGRAMLRRIRAATE